MIRRRGRSLSLPSSLIGLTGVLMLILLSACLESPEAFSMEYKPPVKASVSKFYKNSRSKDSSSQKNAYAASGPALSRRKSFEERMRSAVFRKPAPVQNPIPQVRSMQDFRTKVAEESEKLVVARFYAHFCKSCAKVGPYYQRLAREFSPDVVFVDIPLEEGTSALHQALGVTQVPRAHLYHPERGLVEDVKFTRSDVHSFRDILQKYRTNNL